MTAPRKPKTVAPRLNAEIRQSQIIETVIALAAEHSPGQITTQKIADVIGVTQGALFRHFASKEAIWLAAIDWIEETLLNALEAAASEAGNPLDGLRRVFFAHVDFVVARPGVPRLIFNELQQPADSAIKAAVRQMLQRYRQLVTGLIVAAAEAGKIDRKVDASATAILFIGAIQGLVMQSMLSGHVEAMPKLAEQIFPLFLRSLKETP